LIKKITENLEKRIHLNTAISSMMEFTNYLYQKKDSLMGTSSGKGALREAFKALVKLLSPFTPHICEELWEIMGEKEILSVSEWPQWNEELAREEMTVVVVQINGRVKGRVTVPVGSTEEEVTEEVMKDQKISSYLSQKRIVKKVWVQDKILSFHVE
jgi:leucyl-tRNA synthetase